MFGDVAPGELRIALAQLAPAPGDVEANLDTLTGVVHSHRDADIVVFPELFLSGYRLRDIAELALHIAGDVMTRVARVAQACGTAIVVGFPEARADGVANSLACIDADGRLAAVYRKTHLFDAEREVFIPGDELITVLLAGVEIGPLICFDIEFPEPARALAGAGAQLLLSVAANMDPYGADHDLAARARALDNRLPHVYLNRTGFEDSLVFVGRSQVIAPDGTSRIQLGAHEQVVRTNVPITPAAFSPTDYLSQRRPDLYQRVRAAAPRRSPSATMRTRTDMP